MENEEILHWGNAECAEQRRPQMLTNHTYILLLLSGSPVNADDTRGRMLQVCCCSAATPLPGLQKKYILAPTKP